MHRTIVRTVTGLGLLAWSVSAPAATVPGTTGKKTSCITQLTAPGLGFPAGKAFKGATCADGDTCDADGERNGACVFSTQLCSNVPSGKCTGSTVKSIRLKAKNGSSQQIGQLSILEAAAAALAPTGAQCTVETPLSVPVTGPDGKGELQRGLLDIRGKTKIPGKTLQTRFQFVCLPATAVMPPTTTPTTTTIPPIPGTPRAGLNATITGATITAGTVVVTFTLTDDSGVGITPVLAATTDPDEARVRFTLARINVSAQAGEGGTTTFYEYQNYVTTPVTSSTTHVSSDQPTFDTGGTLTPVDLATGTWTYTFATKVPADANLSLTHTAGAQIERTFETQALAANPLYDFVPAGGAVTTVIQDTTTAQCNSCHDPLQAHGGGRREVGLCQLCHTNQAIDPDTGNTLDFKVMVHKIHAGKDLPTIVDGPVGTKYAFVGFRGAVTTFGEKVKACRYFDTGTNAVVPGPFSGLPCDIDADCGSAGTVPGTCDATTTVGVGFPQEVRTCAKCHTQGATASRYKTLPSAAACTSCHDTTNPSDKPSPAGPTGTNHIPTIQQGFPDANCRLCHTSSGPEFDINIPGAHTVPEQSTQLPGLNGQILSAAGAAGGPVTVTFKVTDKTGAAITNIAGFNRVGFAMSGSTTPDFGYTTKPGPMIAPTAVGGGASGTLTGPDANGVFTYVTSAANSLPVDASGTWRVGLEARREVTVTGSLGDTVVGGGVAESGQGLQRRRIGGEARREVVDIALCQSCHGVFSKGFSVHGNLRNQVEYCVVCHNPSVSDFARRKLVPGADPNDAPIDLKHMLHKVHTGENLEHKPYIIYGFGGSANDFAEVLYPGDRRDCAKCHDPDTYLLPLPAGVHGTLLTQVSRARPPSKSSPAACPRRRTPASPATTATTRRRMPRPTRRRPAPRRAPSATARARSPPSPRSTPGSPERGQKSKALRVLEQEDRRPVVVRRHRGLVVVDHPELDARLEPAGVEREERAAVDPVEVVEGVPPSPGSSFGASLLFAFT